jgi:hypothetical protein
MPNKNVCISIILGTAVKMNMSPYELAIGSAAMIYRLIGSPLVFASKSCDFISKPTGSAKPSY